MSLDDRKYKAGRIREQNSQVILDAAEVEFSLHGYRGTSMQRIADRAGLPKANIHYYYKSKSNLYETVMDRIVDLWNAGLSNISVDDDPAVVLENFIRSKVILACERPQTSKLFATEIIAGAPYFKDNLRTRVRRFVKAKTKIMQTWIAQGKMAEVDPTQLIFLIWSATQHYADFDTQVLTIMNKVEYEEEDITAIADNLVQIILGGCGLLKKHKRQRKAMA